jgi:predicted RNase H-like HicB family nuclease
MMTAMIDIRVHAAEEGGYWAEVLNLHGCASQGETIEELMSNICEAIDEQYL